MISFISSNITTFTNYISIKSSFKFPRPFTPVAQSFEELKGRISSNSAYIITDKDREILQQTLLQYREGMDLTSIPKGQILSALEGLLNSNENLPRVLEALDEKSLLHVNGLDHAAAFGKIQTYATLSEVALKSVLKTKGKALWKEIAPQIMDLIHHFMGILIHFTEITEFGKGEVDSSWEARSKMELYRALLGYPALIFASTLAFTGSIVISLPVTIGVCLGTIATIYIYTRFFRPCPTNAPGLDNLTREVLSQNEMPIYYRHDLIEKVKKRLLSGRGVLLVGDSGCGKTTLIRALAELIAEGHTQFNMNEQLFSGNMATIGGLTSGTSFRALDSMFKPHARQVKFFLDEIHSLFKEGALKEDQADEIKTFLDRYLVIGATTVNEYNQYIKGKRAFLRRFGGSPLMVPAFTDKETIASLKQQLHYQAPELDLEEGVIPYIVKKAGKFQPKTAKITSASRFLKSLISEAQQLSMPKMEKKMTKLRTAIDNMEITLLHNYDSALGEKYLKTKAKFEVLETEFNEMQEKLEQLKKFQAEFVQVKREGYELAFRARRDISQQRKWLANQALCEVLFKRIQQKRLELSLPLKLDKALVDRVLRFEKKNRPAENDENLESIGPEEDRN